MIGLMTPSHVMRRSIVAHVSQLWVSCATRSFILHTEFNQPYSLELKRPSKVVRRWEDLSERPGEPYDRMDDDPSISMEKG